MKIAYAQMKIAAGDPESNTKKILRLIDEARAQGADVVIFPELAVSGRMLGGAWEHDSFLNECERCNEDIIAAAKNIVVVFGSTFADDMWTFNTVYVAGGGRLIQPPVRKTILTPCGEESFSRQIRPDTIRLDAGGKNFSVGLVFDNGDSGADFDIKFSSLPFSLSRRGVTNINRPTIRLGATGIQNTGKTIYTFDGGSAVFNSRGEIVQRAEPFAECLNFVELDEIDKMSALEPVNESEPAKIYRAIHFGVKNFLEQIGMRKVVVGVSGGIDSAVAAALYVDVLGAENVYLVNMPGVFNSATTKNLSEQLAKNLGCKYFVVPIQESVDWTVKQLEGVGIEVSNFVRENIQARDRSSRILAAIAASVGGGFTCNANKAEATVGYATLYGDAAGFLSALADLWKFQVYALANHLNEKIFRREVIPQGIIDLVPSAELSTAQNVDEGKGDPLKYPYHDHLLCAFAERNVSPEEILRWYACGNLEAELGCAAGLVEKYFPTAQDFVDDLERWWRQFTGMGVAKRIQSPPILAVTAHPYGARYEPQNGVHFTRAYRKLKARMLG